MMTRSPVTLAIDIGGSTLKASLLDCSGAMTVAPVRVADLQALAVVTGTGLELTITLGTGFGTSLFYEGRLAPHLEFATHPLVDGETYNQQVGDAALKRLGPQEWNRRVALAIDTLSTWCSMTTSTLAGATPAT